MTLKTQLTYWVECYKDAAQRNALAETPKESAEYLLFLILAEVDKVRILINSQHPALLTIRDSLWVKEKGSMKHLRQERTG